MQQLQQSEATAAQRRLFFHAVDATDGIAAETGLTGVGRLSKNGAATAATSASLTEIDSTNMPGRYYIEFTAAELNTLGVIEFRYKAAACAEVVARAQVVPFDPYDAVRMGLTALPNAAAEAAGGLYTRGTGAGQINQAANGQVDVNLQRMNNVAQTLLDLVDFADAGYDPVTNSVEQVKVNDDVRGTDGVDTTTAAALVNLLWNELTAEGRTVGSYGQLLIDFLDAAVSAIDTATMRGTDGVDTAAMRGTDSALLASADGSSLTDITDRLPAALFKGTADSGGMGSLVDAELTEADDDWYRGQWVRFTSGTLNRQMSKITGFTAASDTLSFTPNVTTSVLAGHTYEILPANVVGIDWGQVLRQASAVDLSTTDIQLVDTIGAIAANAITAAAAATDFINEIRDSILSDATTFAGANIDQAISGNATPTEVLTQVNAALDTAISELAQAIPSATPSLRTAAMLGYMALRGRLITDTSGPDELQIHNDALVVICKKVLTDDGTIYKEEEMVAGP